MMRGYSDETITEPTFAEGVDELHYWLYRLDMQQAVAQRRGA